MSDSSFTEKDQIVGEFLREISNAEYPNEVLDRFSAAYPEMAMEFREVVGMDALLKQAERSAADAGPPRQLGEFLILGRIGSDGMGEIYEAYHERLERQVAVKIIRRGRTSEEARQRFLREQLVLAKLHQTHIVPIHTAGEHDGVQYFAMPYIQGASLDYIVQSARAQCTSSSRQTTPDVAYFAASRSTLNAGNGANPISEASGNGTGTAVTAIRYSRDYHTSVARAMAEVADAVGYAHSAGVLHRDIKPQNIMIEPDGHVWVIDFGLAGFLEQEDDFVTVEAFDDCDDWTARTRLSFDAQPELTQGVGGGTPSYLAPERWMGQKADRLSDIWALGATLYELLALSRAYDARSWEGVRQQILHEPPRSLRALVSGIPADLAAICQKAMHRDPAHRYQSTEELSADLRRWLNHESITARPAPAPRRALLWCRRNRGAAALLGVILLLTSSSAAVISGIAAKKIEGDAAHQRQLGIRAIERMQSTTHAVGWSSDIWSYGTHVPALEGETDLRDVLATSLIDLDARLIYHDVNSEADYLLFDPAGTRLLCGGSTRFSGRQFQAPRILNVETQEWHKSAINGTGPVAFRADGVPVVLVVDPGDVSRVVLFDFNKSEAIASFTTALPSAVMSAENAPLLALSPDAMFAAVAAPQPPQLPRDDSSSKRFSVTVWNLRTTERVHVCTVMDASCLTITPDGQWLAIGRSDGRIGIWRVGAETQLVELQLSRSQVTALAFAKDYVRRPVDGIRHQPGAGWLLATADNAGGLAVWDVAVQFPRTIFRGSYFQTFSLAFSADSTLLASAGRSPCHIWDVATGEPVLTWQHSNYVSGVAMARNGRFATVAFPAHGAPAGLKIYDLMNHRGGVVLRGLRDGVSKLAVSQDGSLIAALTANFQLGVWTNSGRLLHVFETPVGLFADNATIRFSPDNRELFCCTGDRAMTFDLASGAVARDWPVTSAFVNESAWSPDGKHLFLARKELLNHALIPSAGETNHATPRVFRAYDLLSDGGSRNPIIELNGFAERAYRAQVSGDGLLILAGDVSAGAAPRVSDIECWDLLTSRRQWRQRILDSGNADFHLSHGDRRMLAYINGSGDKCEILDPRSRSVISPAVDAAICDDSGRFSASRSKLTKAGGDSRYIVLRRSETSDPLCSFFLGAIRSVEVRLFDYRNRPHLAWSDENGHVTVVDIDQVRSRLDEVGLAWDVR